MHQTHEVKYHTEGGQTFWWVLSRTLDKVVGQGIESTPELAREAARRFLSKRYKSKEKIYGKMSK